MNKLMIAAAAALTASLGYSDVSSSNIVGYYNVTIPAQEYTMIGTQLEGVDGQGEGINIQDLIQNPLDSLPSAANPNSAASAAQLWYWDPTNPNNKYVTLYLCNNTASSGLRYGKWCLSAVPNDTATWGSARNAVCNTRIKPGMGFWLILPSGSYNEPRTITMAGQVVVAESGRKVKLNGNGGYTMISGAFSTGFAPNPDTAGVGPAVDWMSKDLIGAGNPNSAASADQIWFWDSTNPNNKYVCLYLCNNTGSSNLRYNKWCLSAVPNDTATWGSARNTVVSHVIPAGRGFWFIRPAGAPDLELTLDQPYTLTK